MASRGGVRNDATTLQSDRKPAPPTGFQAPLLIVLENAHLGAESLAMVRHLMGLHRMDSFPLCIVSNEDSARLSERPAEAKLLGDLVTSGQVNSLPVLPLHPNQLSQLLIEGLHLSPQTMEALKWRCEDDLYFALELIRDSADQRLLVFEDAQVSLPPDQELKLPKHLHDLWQGRIDRAMKLLDEDADGASRQCFELAALLGRDVHQDEWHDACRRAGHELKQDLINVLLATGLGVGTEDGFRFQHALIVESIIQSSEEDDASTSQNTALVFYAKQRSEVVETYDSSVTWSERVVPMKPCCP